MNKKESRKFDGYLIMVGASFFCFGAIGILMTYYSVEFVLGIIMGALAFGVYGMMMGLLTKKSREA